MVGTPVQTAYSERMAPPMPGVISGSDFDTATGLAETASPGIPFGRAVSQGTLSDKGVVLGGTLAGFRGVSVRDITLKPENNDAYIAPDNVAVLRRGQIWVEPGEAILAHDPVYFNGVTGVFMKSNAGGALGPVKGATWVTSCGIGGRAEVYFDGRQRND